MTTLGVLLLMSMVALTRQNVISIAQGKLRGVFNEGHISYKGIPYASIGSLGQFKRAGLAPFWSGIRESQQSRCSERSDVNECLRLDVHVPTTASSTLSVLVWVRSGGGRYNVGKLVQEGVIVVIVYYRQGPQGFLCLGNERIPGNAGVKDVVLALRWLRDNIVAFRGNPAKIVIAGQDFGAAMIEALMLSPMARGLFHGAILQSGTILSPWTFNYDAVKRAKSLAKMFTDNEDMVTVLLNATSIDLILKLRKLDLPYFPFGMCVEKAFKDEERLLSETPNSLRSNNQLEVKVPLIVGYNSNEAYILASSLLKARVLRRIREDVTSLLPEELTFLYHGEVSQVVKRIREMYFDNNLTMSAVLAYHRDAYFVSHIHRSVRLYTSVSHPVYYYEFSYTGEAGVLPLPGVDKTGAAHSDELAYLFPGTGRDLQGKDEIVQQRLIKLWTNFVKYLNPTPNIGELTRWETVNPHDPRLLFINTELEMRQFPHMKAARMWDDVYLLFQTTISRSLRITCFYLIN